MKDLNLTRDSYYHDIYDEFVSSSNSWSGRVLVRDSHDPYLKVSLEVRAYGHLFKRAKRCRPRRWVARLKTRGFESEPVGEGRCKSLRDVLRQVGALNLGDAVEAFLRSLYSQERAICVWTKRSHHTYRPNRYDVIANDFLGGSDYMPFASMFVPLACSFNHWGNYVRASHIPTGTFIAFEPRYKHWSLIKISSFFTESGIPAKEDLTPWAHHDDNRSSEEREPATPAPGC